MEMQNRTPIQYLKDSFYEAHVFYLAVNSAKSPYIEPIKTHMLANGRLLFGIGDLSYAYHLMQKNRHVTLLAYLSNDSYIRYSGTAIFEEDASYAQQVIRHSPELKRYYNDLTGSTLHMFYLSEARAVYCDHLKNTYTIFESEENL